MRIWTLHIVLSVLFSVFLFSCNEDDGFEESHLDYVSEVEELWALVLPAMWW